MKLYRIVHVNGRPADMERGTTVTADALLELGWTLVLDSYFERRPDILTATCGMAFLECEPV